ncbi:MAG: C40 family peptidase [Pseudomonadota bacterium]
MSQPGAVVSVEPAVMPSTGAQIARHALATLGTPYQWGGESMQGFDCSGLVQFAYGKAGIAVPRTAAEQRRHASPVERDDLQPGDLVFFRIDRKIAHVGIYVEDGRFVHAPATGREVSMERLDTPFYRSRLAGIGRFY